MTFRFQFSSYMRVEQPVARFTSLAVFLSTSELSRMTNWRKILQFSFFSDDIFQDETLDDKSLAKIGRTLIIPEATYADFKIIFDLI